MENLFTLRRDLRYYYRTVKRVRKSANPDCLILEPINKNGYDDQEIPKEIIRDVWQVIGSVKKLF